jgi:uncharacterized protein YvpB
MKDVEHSVKLKLQPTNHSCGQTSAAMLLDYFGERITPAEVIDWVKCVDKNGDETGSVTPQLAAKIAERGFNVDLYTFDLLIINHDWKGLNDDQLIERLRAVRTTRYVPAIAGYEKQYIDAYINLVKAGGKLHIVDYPTTELLYKLLKTAPIFANVCQSVLTGAGHSRNVALRKTKPDENGAIATHSVVIYGIHDGQFLIADSWSGHLTVAPEALLAAISAAQIECDNMIFQITKS